MGVVGAASDERLRSPRFGEQHMLLGSGPASSTTLGTTDVHLISMNCIRWGRLCRNRAATLGNDMFTQRGSSMRAFGNRESAESATK